MIEHTFGVPCVRDLGEFREIVLLCAVYNIEGAITRYISTP